MGNKQTMRCRCGCVFTQVFAIPASIEEVIEQINKLKCVECDADYKSIALLDSDITHEYGVDPNFIDYGKEDWR